MANIKSTDAPPLFQSNHLLSVRSSLHSVRSSDTFHKPTLFVRTCSNSSLLPAARMFARPPLLLTIDPVRCAREVDERRTFFPEATVDTPVVICAAVTAGISAWSSLYMLGSRPLNVRRNPDFALFCSPWSVSLLPLFT